MHVNIVYESQDVNISDLLTFFLSLRISHSVSITNTIEKLQDTINIIVRPQEDNFLVEIPIFSDINIVKAEKLVEELKNKVILCLGLKKTVLTGLTVKDQDGNRLKPSIDIYVTKTLLFEIPDQLSYTKILTSQESSLIDKEEVYFDSKMLNDILNNTTLYFSNNNANFSIKMENSLYYINFRQPKPILTLDLLTNYSVFSDFYNIISSKGSGLSMGFKQFFCTKSEIILSKKFKNQIRNNKDLKYALRVAENCPKFSDSRDLIMDKFKIFLSREYPKEILGKYDYLEVSKQVIPRCKNRYSLRNLLDHMEDQQ